MTLAVIFASIFRHHKIFILTSNRVELHVIGMLRLFSFADLGRGIGVEKQSIHGAGGSLGLSIFDACALQVSLQSGCGQEDQLVVFLISGCLFTCFDP